MKAWRMLLYIAFLVNLYVLLVIILFKMSLPQLDVIYQQVELLLERPALLSGRIEMANFVPLHTIKQSLSGNLALMQWLNLYGNIAIFAPTGIIIALLSKKEHLANAAFVSFIISLSLETMQLLFMMGSFDVDDLILNTAGGLLGAILITAGTRVVKLVAPIKKVFGLLR
ncbi:VanZ family protein [Paenibacillus sp. FSL W7-1287]|uniref:VanZ family protein n=1 Tax=Paenibacillus sp. FSL W7-1287 TaxID=2954538 RepID=UPI0030F8B383